VNVLLSPGTLNTESGQISRVISAPLPSHCAKLHVGLATHGVVVLVVDVLVVVDVVVEVEVVDVGVVEEVVVVVAVVVVDVDDVDVSVVDDEVDVLVVDDVDVVVDVEVLVVQSGPTQGVVVVVVGLLQLPFV